MSVIIKLICIALIYLLVSITLKPQRPEFVFLLRICAVAIVFSLLADDFTEYFNRIISTFSSLNIQGEHIKLLIKVTGIAILTDFIADTLIDSGEKALSGVITIASKVLILYLALPVFNSLLVFCLKFVE